MNHLVTGVTGFVGRALRDRLLAAGHTVYGLSRNKPQESSKHDSRYIPLQADLTDVDALRASLRDISLDGVFHLAAASSVKASWENPALTYQANVTGTSALIDALKSQKKLPRLLLVSSGEVYGSFKEGDVCRETRPVNPQNPYALSKYFCEQIAMTFYKEWTVVVRPFSHLGPGQSSQFAIPNFCEQIREMKKGARPKVLSVGNIRVTRSVTALSDVLDAYLLLMDKGILGEIYQVAGDCRATVEEMLLLLKELSGVDFEIQVDPSRLRPAENLEAPVVNCQKLRSLGWAPKIGIREMLQQVWQSHEN